MSLLCTATVVLPVVAQTEEAEPAQPERTAGIPGAKYVIVLVVQDRWAVPYGTRLLNRQRDQWLKMIAALKEDERIAVMTFGNGLELVQDFTRYVDTLMGAIESAYKRRDHDAMPSEGPLRLEALLPDAETLEEVEDFYAALHLLAEVLAETDEPVYLQLAGYRQPALGAHDQQEQKARKQRAQEALEASGVYILGM